MNKTVSTCTLACQKLVAIGLLVMAVGLICAMFIMCIHVALGNIH